VEGTIYLNWTEREASRTLASLFKNDKEGVICPLSTLEITDCLVFNFLASWVWVKRFSILALIRAWAISCSRRVSS